MNDNLAQIADRHSDVIQDLGEARLTPLPPGPPPLPGPLGPSQAAELAELLEYVQGVLREATESAVMRPGGEAVEIDFAPWQAILDLQATLAELLRRVSEPKDGTR